MLGDEHWAIKNESTEATFWWSVQSKSWSVTGLAHQIAELLNTWNNPTTCQKLWSGLGDKHTLRAYSWACPWIQSPDNICRPLGSGQAADNVLWKAGPRKQGCHNLLRREAGCSSVSSWRSKVDIWLLSDFPIQRQDFFFFFLAWLPPSSSPVQLTFCWDLSASLTPNGFLLLWIQGQSWRLWWTSASTFRMLPAVADGPSPSAPRKPRPGAFRSTLCFPIPRAAHQK